MTTDAGVMAMENIARRFQNVFPDILTEEYSRDRFHFRHTGSQRTNRSIQAFATGLFGEAGAQNVVYEDVPERDWFLRPFDFCPDFWDDVADWQATRNGFREGPEYAELVDNVNRRLGFHANRLSFRTIQSMWEWCRFETGSTFEMSGSDTGADSAWCIPFSVADQLLFEYYEDLGHFYFSGYGVPNQRLLENMNCGVMQDLLNHIDNDDDDETVARIFVTYTQEIQSMLVALGSFRDTWPIHQHNYAQQSSRNWLTSLIAQLGSNLSVIRYE